MIQLITRIWWRGEMSQLQPVIVINESTPTVVAWGTVALKDVFNSCSKHE
jgi:hypothetical protein